MFDRAVQIATIMELSEKYVQQLQAGTAVVEYLGAKDKSQRETTTAEEEAGREAVQGKKQI